MKTLKVVAISDLHGMLPSSVPECDLLLIAGDVCPHGTVKSIWKWLGTRFIGWLERQPVRHTVLTWGNHDWVGFPPLWDEEKNPFKHEKKITLLLDSAFTFDGLKIYGSPWSPVFQSWAFMKSEAELAEHWAAIPDDTDILLLHGPPRGYGDLTVSGVRCGSPSLTARIREVRPTLTVCGHIHEGYGVYDLDGVTVANVSLLDEKYRMVNQPFRTELSVP